MSQFNSILSIIVSLRLYHSHKTGYA